MIGSTHCSIRPPEARCAYTVVVYLPSLTSAMHYLIRGKESAINMSFFEMSMRPAVTCSERDSSGFGIDGGADTTVAFKASRLLSV